MDNRPRARKTFKSGGTNSLSGSHSVGHSSGSFGGGHHSSGGHSGGYSGALEIFMTERMLHSKLLMNERRIMIGSCNINRKSFTKLDELAVAADNDDSPFASEIRSSVREAFQNAEPVSARGRIRYDPVLAAIETSVM